MPRIKTSIEHTSKSGSRSRILLWGGTGQSRVLRELLAQLAPEGPLIVAIGDNRPIPHPFSDQPQLPLILGIQELSDCLHSAEHENLSFPTEKNPLLFAVAVGGDNGRARLELASELKTLGLTAFTAIHPRSFTANDAAIGEGSQILAMAAVCSNARIGEQSILNTSCSVDHDCVIGRGVHIGPSATLAGEVEIGDCVFVGSNATILPRIRVGNDSVIGAGAVVTKNIPPHHMAVGIPARIWPRNKRP